MRKFIAIFFLLLAAATTDAGIQLLKFPLLLRHFYTHLEQGRSRNLADFLAEHYATGDHQDHDQQDDRQLPFKSSHSDLFSFTYLPPRSFADLYQPSGVPAASAPGYSFYFQQHLNDVFHPPRC